MRPSRSALGTLGLAMWAGAQDAVLSEGFESGNVSAWTFADTDDGDLPMQAGAALAGSEFGLRAIVDDTAGIYVHDDSPNDKNRYRARFYFDA